MPLCPKCEGAASTNAEGFQTGSKLRKVWLIGFLGLVLGCSQGWQRKELKLEGLPEATIAFMVRAQDKIDTPAGERTAELAISCGGNDSIRLVATRLPIETGDVRIAFDGETPVSQKWLSASSYGVLLSPPKESENNLLSHLINAKTFRVELTPKGGKPQFSSFNLRNINDLMSQEKACRPWLAQLH
jgi:hypothetical protein